MAKHDWESKWKLVEKMSSGGQAHTFCVRRVGSSSEQSFVLKELKQQSMRDRRQRMNAEVANLQLLEHTGVARHVDSNAYEWESMAEVLYLVMDFVPGAHVYDALNQSRPELLQTLRFMEALLGIVDYCHGKGVVHRDIKPENVILRNGVWSDPVLIDFGLSFNEEAAPDPSVTAASVPVGNRFLRLPELESGSADKRSTVSDIAACTGMLYLLMCGTAPRVLIDERGLAPQARPEYVAAAETVPEPLRTRVRRVFDRGFQQVLASRWPGASALKDAISAIRHEAEGSVAPWDFAAALDSLASSPEISTREEYLKRKGDLFGQLNKLCGNTWTLALQKFQILWGHSHGTRVNDSFQGVFQWRGEMWKLPSSGERIPLVVEAKVDGGEIVVRTNHSGDRPILQLPIETGDFELQAKEAIERTLIAFLQARLRSD